jgi:histidinol-phosphatase
MRAAVAEAFPQDGILGEEGTSVASRSGRRWVLDPIDGTRSFSCGVPLYGVLLSLEVEGAPVLGCCRFPALGQTLVAARGAGAWFNGTRARVSDCASIAEARLVTSGLEYWRNWAPPLGLEGWSRLVSSSRFTRTWGDSYGYSLIATGRADIMADPASGAVWDYLPMVTILEEAGGRYTTIGGTAVHAWSTALATNGKLHDAAIRCWSDDFEPMLPA